jgi:hypothetical protein
MKSRATVDPTPTGAIPSELRPKPTPTSGGDWFFDTCGAEEQAETAARIARSNGRRMAILMSAPRAVEQR